MIAAVARAEAARPTQPKAERHANPSVSLPHL